MAQLQEDLAAAWSWLHLNSTLARQQLLCPTVGMHTPYSTKQGMTTAAPHPSDR